MIEVAIVEMLEQARLVANCKDHKDIGYFVTRKGYPRTRAI